MTTGQVLYRAYVCSKPGDYWIDTGETTDMTIDGKAIVKFAGSLIVRDDKWRTTEVEAKRDAVAGIARQIGAVQAKLDALRDEILHDDLTTEEVHHGVA
jgi:hypothetical protein